MAILSRQELLEKVNARFTDDNSDEVLSLIEDITDTITSMESGGEDWKAKYEQNDADWRKRYRDRFFSTDIEPPKDETTILEPSDQSFALVTKDESPDEPSSYEDLFETV